MTRRAVKPTLNRKKAYEGGRRERDRDRDMGLNLKKSH